jgi:pimeloyl-ACP methyl ester carboxylesterase
MFARLIVVLLVAAVVAPAQTAVAQSSGVGSFRSTACPWEGLDLGPFTIIPEDEGFECGSVTVPERHADPAGPTIEIPVAIRRDATAAGATPLFLAQGGPGGSAFEVFSLVAPGTAAAAGRDIVIFNQRGTSFAAPDLSCTESFDAARDVLAADEETALRLYRDLATRCHQRLLDDGVDLSAYNSVENAADVPVLAAALGYEQIDFYGVSYGTLLGLHLMRDHPEVLRSVVLDAVVPTQLNFVPEVAASENRMWDEVFAQCTSDPVCAADYPDLENRLFALVDRLDRDPLTLEVEDPDTGDRIEVPLTGTALLDLLFQVLYTGGGHAFVPRIIADVDAGDLTAFEFYVPLIAFDRSFSEGMYYSVLCTEDADFTSADVDLDGVRPAIADGAVRNAEWLLDTCAMWDVEELDALVDDPVVSDVPTLLLSGRFDPITPPSNAELAAATLSSSTHVVHPYGAHGVAFDDPCIDRIMRVFLDDPAVPPDTTCVASIEPAETVPADAVTLPIVAGFGQLETGFLLAALISIATTVFTYTTAPVALGLAIRQRKRRPPLRGPVTSVPAPPAASQRIPLRPLPPPAFPTTLPHAAEPAARPGTPPPWGPPPTVPPPARAAPAWTPTPAIDVPARAPAPATERPRWIRWPAALGLAAAYGLLATVLGVGLTAIMIDVIVNRTAYLGAVALPPGVRWLLTIPWVLAVLAAAIVVIAVRRWRVPEWSRWGKVYYSLVAVAAVTGVVTAATQGLFVY